VVSAAPGADFAAAAPMSGRNMMVLAASGTRAFVSASASECGGKLILAVNSILAQL
jgi:hypothetical protein